MDFDRALLQGCLSGNDDAWRAFVDRFLGLVTHVVNHAAECRAIHLTSADREDCIADVFVALLDSDYAVLRRFRGQSSLATYLTVVARRVATRRLMTRSLAVSEPLRAADAVVDHANGVEERVQSRDLVQKMLGGLADAEAAVVRLYHLEGKSYHEISRVVGLPENTIGPMLTRLRRRLQHGSAAE
ncbi:MAG: RNA polymerase sigma factor [Lacipirellulaceae bacterium]